ncbi:MAG: amidohydrolase [Flavobacteriia bacterium]|jgi:imidazolonepropionase-like amidohydrolase
MIKNSLYIICLLVGVSALAQTPKRILLTNGILHVGNGEIVTSAAIGIEEGKIKFVKNSLTTTIVKSEWDTIIDLQNQHVYPGFVAPNSTLGLTEIDAVRATNDFNEVGDLNPHIRSLIAFNVESKVISTVRTNGVLMAQATPRGGTISGSSSVMHLAGWNWEDAAVSVDDGIHLNWPESVQGNGWRAKPEDIKRNEEYEKAKREIVQFCEAAKLYAENPTKYELDVRYAAMKDVFFGSKRLYIHANDVQQLLDIIDFAKLVGIKFPVIVGGYDAYLITERLRDSKIPVMLPRLHSLPQSEDDAVDLPYRLPFLLHQGQVKFCLQNEGDMEAMNARNLPFLAGTAMAYGLPDEEAVKAISLSTCEIMGIDKNYGSVVSGKKATLFVSKGPALDMKTNDVTLILMDGDFVETTNMQTELYEKYKKKYGVK